MKQTRRCKKKNLESEKGYPIANYYHSTQRGEIILMEINQAGGM